MWPGGSRGAGRGTPASPPWSLRRRKYFLICWHSARSSERWLGRTDDLPVTDMNERTIYDQPPGPRDGHVGPACPDSVVACPGGGSAERRYSRPFGRCAVIPASASASVSRRRSSRPIRHCASEMVLTVVRSTAPST